MSRAFLNDRPDASALVKRARSQLDPEPGQLSLRFFCPERCAEPREKATDGAAALEDLANEEAEFEDIELKHMLSSCRRLELRSGSEVIQLAAQRVVADEWLQALTTHCLLNYPKASVFNDKEVRVKWVDGREYTCSIGENTLAGDIVKRLCKLRTTTSPALQQVPVVHDPNDWALFELQRHGGGVQPTHLTVGASATATAKVVQTPHWRQLPNHEPLLDQVLVRWEMTARREYGAAPTVPPGSFELVLRKVRVQGSRNTAITRAEAELEALQARSDVLDGRLLNVLGEEYLDVGAVLALREMHVHPREARPEKSKNAQKLEAARKKKNEVEPTLDFKELRLSELWHVLPGDILRADGADASDTSAQARDPVMTAYESLKQRYERLFRRGTDSWGPAERSQTAQIIKLVRSEAVGVSFDVKGQVVVDKKGAERILRDRFADEPLCFGSTYVASVWEGRDGRAQSVLIALNHSGIHLHTIEPRPRRLGSFLFEWQTNSRSPETTIVGWQVVPHGFETDGGGSTTQQHTAEDTASLVVHLLVTPSESDLHEFRSKEQAAGASGNGSMSARGRRTGSQLIRKRAKLVLLTREGEDMRARLQQYAQEYAQHERSHPGGARSFFTTPAGAGRSNERSSWANRMTSHPGSSKDRSTQASRPGSRPTFNNASKLTYSELPDSTSPSCTRPPPSTGAFTSR